LVRYCILLVSFWRSSGCSLRGRTGKKSLISRFKWGEAHFRRPLVRRQGFAADEEKGMCNLIKVWLGVMERQISPHEA
jgi:hypothetical protein